MSSVITPENPSSTAAHTHDGFFKAIFSQPEHATAFFKSHLPSVIVSQIDWPSLIVLPGSFVKSSLQQMHSDLLFSVRIGERETLLYLLFEHQSTPDPAMPLRLLGYLTKSQESFCLSCRSFITPCSILPDSILMLGRMTLGSESCCNS